MTTQQQTTRANMTSAYPFVFGNGASHTSTMTNPTTINNIPVPLVATNPTAPSSTHPFARFATTMNSPFTFTSPTTTNPFGTTAATITTSPFGATIVPSQPFGTGASTITSPFGTTTVPTQPFGTGSTTATRPFGTTTAIPTQPFGTRATATTSPFGTTTASTQPFGNNATTATIRPFGITTAAPTQPFGTGASATTSPFGTTTVPTQPFGTGASATTSPFGTTTAPTQPFGTNATTTPAQPFGIGATTATRPFGTTTAASTQPFGTTIAPTQPFGTGATATTSPFGTTTTAPTQPFGTGTSATTSPFGTTTALTQPFGTGATTATIRPFGTTTAPAQPFGTTTAPTQPFGTNATTTTRPFATTTALAQPFGATAPTTTIPFATTTAPAQPFGTIASSITNPVGTGSSIAPFSYAASATSILNPGSSVSTSNPLLPTTAQPLKQENPSEQPSSIIKQGFLTAALLDPYANRGTKDFSAINRIQVVQQPTTDLTVTSSKQTQESVPIVTLPLQTNSRKSSPARPVNDINFKLKPVSTTSSLSADMKPKQSTLASNFTDEEELVLLSRNKLSKLRLSNDFIDSSNQSNTLRSLYPIRRLADLEKFSDMTTVENQRQARSSSEHRTAPTNTTVESRPLSASPPTIQRKTIVPDVNKFRLPILTRENYYTIPKISELKALFNDQGQCFVKKFTVGHEQYGSVTFYGQMNVAGLNLDEIIEIDRHEVTVYPDESKKPAVGHELNRSARITLLGVYPIDRSTRQEITDVNRIQEMNYTNYLRETTKKFDGEFINYEMTDGAWTFMVEHFTTYGLHGNQNEFLIQS